MGVILGLSLGLPLSSCASDPPRQVEPISTSSQDRPTVSDEAEKGRRIFNSKGACFLCHGKNADGRSNLHKDVPRMNPPPTDLRNPQALRYQTDEDVYRVISQGIKGTAMIGVGPSNRSSLKLQDEEIKALVEYLRELRKKH